MSGAVGDLGEDGLVADVLARYRPAPEFVRVGPGDDAAVLDVPGLVVVSTDTLVEGPDFRRAWSSGRDVGVKAAAQNLADVAAMGARPLALLVSLATPPDLPAGWAGALADGLEEECLRAGAAVVGGDVSEAGQVVVTGTALGVLDGAGSRPVLRGGARPGDVVALAGRTGPSAAGLALLTAGFAGPSPFDALLAAHRAPRPDYPAGPAAAAAGATALIDTSDGLLRDATRIAAASGVALDLDRAALLPGTDLVDAAAALQGEERAADLALGWVLTGGEDHALLACFPPGTDVPPPYLRIGTVVEAGDAGNDVLVDGSPWRGPTGWRHFA
jgi:thiamine-monophosphate kinase